MSRPTLITGHRNPDSDSICATLAYAELKKQLGENVLPIRIGDINAETAFILNKFNMKAPKRKYNLQTKISDITIDEELSVRSDTTISRAWKLMIENNRKVITITDDYGRLEGIATISAITNAILSLAQNNYTLMRQTPIQAIADTLWGRVLVEPKNYNPSGVISIASGMLVDKDFIQYKDKIVLSSTRYENQVKAIKTGAALLVLCVAKETSQEIIDLAIEHDCGIIVTTLDQFSASQLITQSIPIELIMTKDLVTFDYNDSLDEVKTTITKSRYRSYPVVDSLNRLKGLISRYHLWDHEKIKIILVDHNETQQSIEGIEEAEIVEIIDHHRLGDVETNTPVMFRNEIIGSTCSIITKMYFENDVEIPKNIAGILLGAIISDTMNFNSPTCTAQDRKIAEKLSEISGVDIDRYAEEIYIASATLSDKSLDEVVHTDFKEFVIEDYSVAISQINIIDPEHITSMKDELESYLNELSQEKQYDICVVMISDIREKGSYFVTAGPDVHIIKNAFKDVIQNMNGLAFVPNALSRKKQIVPSIAKAILAFKTK